VVSTTVCATSGHRRLRSCRASDSASGLFLPLLHRLGQFDDLLTKVDERGQDIGRRIDMVIVAAMLKCTEAVDDVANHHGVDVVGPSFQGIDALDQVVDGIRQGQEPGDAKGIIDIDVLTESLDPFPVGHCSERRDSVSDLPSKGLRWGQHTRPKVMTGRVRP
jgi:hypothetical protein